MSESMDALQDLGSWSLDPRRETPALVRVQPAKPRQLRLDVKQVCPRKPGVYGMVDEHGELIYVGKAKCLRTRLFSYFRRKSRTRKMGKILQQARAIVWEVWSCEFAALHRELELIRRWRPRWNVQGQPLRRQLTWLCLGRAPAPYVYLSRRPGKARVFAPLPMGERARAAVRRLNDCFKLRDCPDSQEMIFPDQPGLYPLERTPGCMRFDLGTCAGPCTGVCTRDAYQGHVRDVGEFLDGKPTTLLNDLQRELLQAAERQQYERAASLRDRIESLQWLQARVQSYRRSRAELSFIYEVTGWDHGKWWFLIHTGRTLAVVPAPSDEGSSETARTLIADIYFNRRLSPMLDAYEPIDSMMLVSSWFRKYPQERRRTLSATEALQRCTAS